MTYSTEIKEIAGALAKAQAAMAPAIKDSVNPAYRSKYADLTAVWEACRKPLTDHGLSVLQDVTLSDMGVSVTTRLLHQSGQWIEFGPLTVPLAKQDAHGVGSAASYGKRYGLSAAIGIVAEEDDDGNDAVGNGASKSDAPAGAMETATVKVLGITKRDMGGWLKFTIAGDDRKNYMTKKEADAKVAKDAQAAGSALEITWKQTQYGRDVVALREDVPEPPL